MSSNDIAISVRGLSKAYTIAHNQEQHVTLAESMLSRLRRPFRRAETETFWALKDVSFDIKKGDVVGIIGRNGAGKSTLLKVLSRITEPTAGEIDVYGRIGSLLEVGTGFHPELTGRENIYLNGAILGMRRKEIDRQFDAIVDFSGVEKFLDTPVKRYSSGMYVRLAFAVAAHLESEIMVVDEVLAVGDTGFQKKCLGKMRDVATDGRTVIFVSHNMQAVQNLCSRAVYLRSGQLQLIDSVSNVVSHYLEGGSPNRARWTRVLKRPSALVPHFNEVTCVLSGEQPDLKLKVEVQIDSALAHADAFVAVDICDSAGDVLMQALPTLDRLVRPSPTTRKMGLEIDLPPLVPGTYSLTLWMGPHNGETFDSVQDCVSFEVTDSPTPGRTFPHTIDHGRIVPKSKILEVAVP